MMATPNHGNLRHLMVQGEALGNSDWCVTVGKSFNPPAPYFSHLQNGSEKCLSNGTLVGIKCVKSGQKCFEQGPACS